MYYNKDKNRYDYMLNMPHHQSSKHKHMSMTERAAQFGAFRALTGYEAAITETGRITDKKAELDEYEKEVIDMQLQYIRDNIDKEPVVSVTYFIPDEKKSGGKYVQKKGSVKKLHDYERVLIFSDKDAVLLDDIVMIDTDLSDYTALS